MAFFEYVIAAAAGAGAYIGVIRCLPENIPIRKILQITAVMAGGAAALCCRHLYGLVEGGLTFLFICILEYAALMDIYTLEIADECSVLIAVLSAAAGFLTQAVSPVQRLSGMFIIALPMFVSAKLVPGSFGGAIW